MGFGGSLAGLYGVKSVSVCLEWTRACACLGYCGLMSLLAHKCPVFEYCLSCQDFV